MMTRGPVQRKGNCPCSSSYVECVLTCFVCISIDPSEFIDTEVVGAGIFSFNTKDMWRESKIIGSKLKDLWRESKSLGCLEGENKLGRQESFGGTRPFGVVPRY